ncbi:MAG: hypothetical protein AAF805_07020 [Planctomycetota bacterium]
MRALALSALVLTAATAAHAQSGRPFTIEAQLPGGENVETALDGHCPVCIVEMKAWKRGDERFASVYDGRRYLFPSAKERAIFDADPAKYAPAAGGDCVVCRVEMGKSVPGSARFAARYDGRVYLFPGDEQRQTFLADPERYATADLAYDGDCAVCRVDMKHRMAGNEAHTAVHDGKRYLFPSDRERQVFLANPMKYAEPQG